MGDAFLSVLTRWLSGSERRKRVRARGNSKGVDAHSPVWCAGSTAWQVATRRPTGHSAAEFAMATGATHTRSAAWPLDHQQGDRRCVPGTGRTRRSPALNGYRPVPEGHTPCKALRRRRTRARLVARAVRVLPRSGVHAIRLPCPTSAAGPVVLSPPKHPSTSTRRSPSGDPRPTPGCRATRGASRPPRGAPAPVLFEARSRRRCREPATSPLSARPGVAQRTVGRALPRRSRTRPAPPRPHAPRGNP